MRLKDYQAQAEPVFGYRMRDRLNQRVGQGRPPNGGFPSPIFFIALCFAPYIPPIRPILYDVSV